jgi:hypothetical protein
VIEAMTEDNEAAGPVSAPANPYPRVTNTGIGLEVHYPAGLATLLVTLIALALTAVLSVALVSFASTSLAAELRAGLLSRWPQWAQLTKALLDYPTAFLLATLFLWWMFAGSLMYRPSSVVVEPGGVAIRRLVWTTIALPFDVIRAVQSSNNSVSFIRSDRSLLRSFVMASPNLRSPHEANWLAGELRGALKRSGWRGAKKA